MPVTEISGGVRGSRLGPAPRKPPRRRALAAASAAALLRVLAAHDSDAAWHSESVVGLSLTAARALGLRGTRLTDVEHTARLHDVGKVCIPEAILRKPGPLGDWELAIVRQHAVAGGRLVASMPGLGHLEVPVRGCHERWDGDGYPDGLRGEEIPLSSRIVAVCDAYEAITSDRPYRRARSHRFAVEEIGREAGRQFCPSSAAALLGAIGAG